MKFDFVIGNPPYQEEVAKVETENGQKRSKSIFHFFQISADEIATSGSVWFILEDDGFIVLGRV